jgi:hypothetical protein
MSELAVTAVFALAVLGPRSTLHLCFEAGKLWRRGMNMLRDLKAQLDPAPAAAALKPLKNGMESVRADLAAAAGAAVSGKSAAPRFTVPYKPAALSSEALQSEIDALRAQIAALGSASRASRRHGGHSYEKCSFRRKR